MLLRTLKTAAQWMLIPSLLVLSWLAMQAVHELGHVLGAWLMGAAVERVILHPLTISRTDVSPNAQPTTVVWLGPVTGTALPALAWLAALAGKVSWTYLLRFFAGFCLVANGLYIGTGAFHPVGDAADLITHGVPRWQLAAFGLICVPCGFLLWNGQAANFGLTRGSQAPPWAHALTVAALLVALILAEMIWSSR